MHDVVDPFELPDGSLSYEDFTKSRNQRFTNPQLAARNRLAKPSNHIHWFNTPPSMTEERLRKLYEDAKCAEIITVTIFNTKSERSASGLVEFKDAEAATEAMMIANHIPIEEPGAKAPYIFKMSFSSN